MMQTIRQQLISLLEDNEMTAKEISQALSIREKNAYEHLTHIQRSVKAQKKKLHVNPFRCRSCNFVFEDRRRLTKPGRCPKCKNGQIEAATFWIC